MAVAKTSEKKRNAESPKSASAENDLANGSDTHSNRDRLEMIADLPVNIGESDG
jgi:hypothetical protein